MNTSPPSLRGASRRRSNPDISTRTSHMASRRPRLEM